MVPTSTRRAPLWRVLTIGLTMPRADLFRAIDARYAQMLRDGWLNEVAALLARGVNELHPAMSGVGYSELARVVRGGMSLEEAMPIILLRARQLVRRQYAWFRLSDPAIAWLEVSDQVVERAAALVAQFVAREPARSTTRENLRPSTVACSSVA